MKPISAPNNMCEAYEYNVSSPPSFSRGMEISIADERLLFISGTASIGAGGETLYRNDIYRQSIRTFENVAEVLRNADMDWTNVVKVTIFLKDINYNYKSFNEARANYFIQIGLITYPASTCVEARLCRNDLLVEMEALAVKHRTLSPINRDDWECM